MDTFAQSARYFETPIQQAVYLERYSRYRYDLGRRESWIETVDRAVGFLRELSQNKLPEADYDFIGRMVLEMRAMPSMRLLSMAGDAARRNNTAIFNCTYLPLDSSDAFCEVMLLSMNGCGVGYSVESFYTAQLPRIVTQSTLPRLYHLVEDTTEGWVEALREGLLAWFSGRDIEYSYFLVRPAGTPLRTKGGRASGPEPLEQALNAIRSIILARQGKQLRPIDAHDIACWIASASISGGVRRSALISLFDADDTLMRQAKAGNFWEYAPQRMYANNSAVIGDWTTGLELAELLEEMDRNGTGEPGLFNRDGVVRQKPSRRESAQFGLNPCGEIALRPMQLCNLSSVVCRADDDLESLVQKVRAATIIGTIQSMADYFPGLRPQWAENQRNERLLGVDLNGQMDCPLVQRPEVQAELLRVAEATNERYARLLGINRAAAITTVKPSGNSGQLLNASSGLHARWSPYYVRNIRFNRHSPVRKLMADQGVPMSPENGQTWDNANTFVVPFPVKSPAGAIFRHDRTALEQLDYWLQVRTHWTEHQPSVTITYRPEELRGIIDWCRRNKDYIAGLSFLPANDHTYPQAPYQEITAEEFSARAADFPELDFSRIAEYETDDMTTSAQEVACTANGCET